MTRDEFERGYCERSKISVEENRKYSVALPCACSDQTCPGWAMVSLTDPGLLISHLALYLPDRDVLERMEHEEHKPIAAGAKP